MVCNSGDLSSELTIIPCRAPQLHHTQGSPAVPSKDGRHQQCAPPLFQLNTEKKCGSGTAIQLPRGGLIQIFRITFAKKSIEHLVAAAVIGVITKWTSARVVGKLGAKCSKVMAVPSRMQQNKHLQRNVWASDNICGNHSLNPQQF